MTRDDAPPRGFAQAERLSRRAAPEMPVIA